ncbi:MAG: hypothetical protein HQ591_02430 [candidate division Zixibacteria bacterium]|nr:hypothetical protein [Candidatus Tariuqbacter arcticus]
MENGRIEIFEMFLRNWTSTLHPLKGVTQFPDYRFLNETARSLTMHKFLLIPKSRQMMVSWIMCALTLFRALDGGLHLLLSKNQFSADELLRRICFIFDHLPRKLRLGSSTRNRSELEISKRGRIISLPATEDAPRMHSPTSVFWDEMAFTPFSDKIWTALKPCLDNGASFVGVSTPNGSGGIFAELVKGAPENGFAIHKVHWKSHPERDEAWAENARKGLSEVEWRREYEISFEGSSDLVYPEFTGNNILLQNHRYNPAQPVFRAIDFGYRHPFVLWLQEIDGGKLVVFDEWAGDDATVEQMIKTIKGMDAKYGIAEEKVVFTACDPAGASVDSEGIAPIERLKRAGFKLRYRPSRIATGVELVKSLLRDANGETRLFFSPNINRLTEDIRRYRWKPGADEPEKDGICDHSMDALRYFAVNYLYAPSAQVKQARVRGMGR